MAKTATPSGLTITRNGNNFTFKWKRNNSPTSQQLQYRLYAGGKWGNWVSLSIGAGTTSKAVTVSASSFYPNGKVLTTVQFHVRGKKSGKWSNWVAKSFSVAVPNTPTVSATLSNDYTNVCSFTWSLATSATDARQFTNVEWQSVLQNGYSESQIKSIANWSTLTDYKSGVSTLTSYTLDVTEQTTNIQSGSHTRWFRVRARGIRGASAWAYAKHVYASPYQAIINSKQVTPTATGSIVNVNWTVDEGSSAFPIDNVTVRYSMAVPDADLAFPSSGTWTDANVSVDAGKLGAATFEIDTPLDVDQCLFVQVNTKHDTVTTYGIPTIAQLGRLDAPSNLSVTTNDSNYKATVTATNESDVPDSFLAVKYCPTSNPEGLVLGIIPHGSSSVTVQCPNWSDETAVAFEVYAVQGSYTTTPLENGVTEYRIDANMISASVSDGGSIPVAPEDVSVTATDVVGTVQVKWAWSWSDADGAEISWADHEDAWESTSAPSTFEVTNLHSSKWNVVDLETGVTWYFRVRLFNKNGDDVTYGAYSDTYTIDLSSAPTTPVMKLSAGVIPTDGMTTATWAYISTDGTGQSYAEICEATYENNVLVYGEVIASTKTAQHIDIYAEDVGWNAGEVHYLCLRVQSASGKLSDSWSDPVPVIIAEPMECEITDTSLEDVQIAENERTYTGDLISFTSDDVVPIAESLVTDLTPIQDLHGYDAPWVGGAGKNKVPPFSTNSRDTGGITFTQNADGTVTVNGTATETVVWREQFTFSGGRYIVSGGLSSNNFFGIQNSDSTYVARSFGSDSSAFDLTAGTYFKTLRIGNGETVTNAVFKPMMRLSSVSDATFAPYENICPISGHTEVDVVRTGKNLADFTDGYSVGANGLPSAYSKRSATTTPILIKPGETYKGICSGTNVFLIYSVLDENNSLVRRETAVTSGTVLDTSGGTYLYVCGYDSADTNTITAEGNGLMVIRGSETDTTYEPYNGTTYTIQFEDEQGNQITVYGGNDEIVGGFLTVDRVLVTLQGQFTGSSLSEGTNTVRGFFSNSLFTDAIKPNNTTTNTLYCDKFETYAPDYIVSNDVMGISENKNATSNGLWFRINKSLLNAYTWAGITEWFNNNPTQVCYKLKTPTTTQLTPQQIELLLGENNIFSSDNMTITVADNVIDTKALTELPLTITVSGAGDAGNVTVAIERADNYFLDRPDETEFVGYEGETVALGRRTGDGIVEFDVEDLLGMLDDGASYRIVATVNDELGQSATDTLDFEVMWNHQALMPTATITLNEDIMEITPIAPTGIATGDVCDIYRLSADKPQLIVSGASWGTKYVDPYPTIGDFGGYRIAFKSKYGDYITADNILAWTDYGKDENVYYYTPKTIIDFGSETVELLIDMTLSNEWEKDFKETKYLGGSVTGDWNKAVTRKGSINATNIRFLDAETISLLHRLADHTGICHVRMPDGTNIHADVEVSLNSDWGNSPKTTDCSLSITRVDGEGLDGLTYAEWSA